MSGSSCCQPLLLLLPLLLHGLGTLPLLRPEVVSEVLRTDALPLTSTAQLLLLLLVP
jgi:hypothetical protein